MPGTRITKSDRLKIDKKFICIVCNMLLASPMQTPCGHLMCFTCLQFLLSRTKATCPLDGTELKKEEVFPDAFTRRELKGLILQCPNSGCTWRSTYDELESHLSICDHSIIKCVHEACEETFKRSLLGEHLRNFCQYRSEKCRFCGVEFQIASIKEHEDSECPKAPVTCEYCGAGGIPRKDILNHQAQLCDEVPVKCKFLSVGCDHKEAMKQKEMRQHSNDSLIHHVDLLLDCVVDLRLKVHNVVPRSEFTDIVQKEIRASRVNLSGNLGSVYEKLSGAERRVAALESAGDSVHTDIRALTNMISELKTSLRSSQDKNRSLERELREKDGVIERLRNRIDQLDESLALNTVKLNDLEGTEVSHVTTTPSYNGTLLWKIEQFQRKRQDALSGIKTAVYSPHFYSSQYGYKMCVKIYMNGDGFGKGTHISLFFVVMKGEYDALQVWPFQKKITMMLLDQQNGDHMVDAFHSDPQSSSFQRPKSDMNIASGSPLFMPLDGLNKRSYVKDDVMFIKIIVD